MNKLNGTLYSSNAQIQRVFKVFLQLHQCKVCDRFFTEFDNVGSWKCCYHPGTYDYNTRQYTCCGETSRKMFGDYPTLGNVMPWNADERLNIPDLHTKGCCACDCVSKYRNVLPQEKVLLKEIACIIPSLAEHGSRLEDRAGLKKGANACLERKQRLRKIFWHQKT